MKRIAIVILNYLNYEDTIECIESCKTLSYPLCGIVVVDNGSTNRSAYEIYKKYHDKPQIHILKMPKNLGFARGNNVGINYARNQLAAEFVLAVNNDTLFIQKDYIQKLLTAYEFGVAVIGGRVLLKDGVQSQPSDFFSIKDEIKFWINRETRERGCSFDFVMDEKNRRMFLHGCALMFTPVFFQYYRGFYPRTFLYCEENILYLMCSYKGLTQKYVDDAAIYHKEDQSSALSFGNDSMVMKKYSNQSRKYIMWWLIKEKFKRGKNE